MRKIVFFTEHEWAYGSIHYALCRVLYKEGLLCEVLNWNIPRQLDEMKAILATADYFITTPLEVGALLSYQVPIERIKIVAHGEIDLLNACKMVGYQIFNNCAAFGVVGPTLCTKAIELGIRRVPKILHVGVEVDRYFSSIPESLKTVGYGAIMSTYDFYGNEIKRGALVEKACKIASLEFRSSRVQHYLAMPQFYKEVDCVVMSSTQESVGLPMLEAGVAGRLVIGTPVGYNITNEVSIQVPINEVEFIERTVDNLIYYKQNAKEFRERCLEVQRYSTRKYSWESSKQEWADFLS